MGVECPDFSTFPFVGLNVLYSPRQVGRTKNRPLAFPSREVIAHAVSAS